MAQDYGIDLYGPPTRQQYEAQKRKEEEEKERQRQLEAEQKRALDAEKWQQEEIRREERAKKLASMLNPKVGESVSYDVSGNVKIDLPDPGATVGLTGPRPRTGVADLDTTTTTGDDTVKLKPSTRDITPKIGYAKPYGPPTREEAMAKSLSTGDKWRYSIWQDKAFPGGREVPDTPDYKKTQPTKTKAWEPEYEQEINAMGVPEQAVLDYLGRLPGAEFVKNLDWEAALDLGKWVTDEQAYFEDVRRPLEEKKAKGEEPITPFTVTLDRYKEKYDDTVDRQNWLAKGEQPKAEIDKAYGLAANTSALIDLLDVAQQGFMQVPIPGTDLTVGEGFMWAAQGLTNYGAMRNLDAQGLTAEQEGFVRIRRDEAGNVAAPDWGADLYALTHAWKNVPAQVEAAFTPNEAQAMLPERDIEYAQALGVSMAHHGLGAAGAAFDEYLNKKLAAQEYAKMAENELEIADQIMMTDPNYYTNPQYQKHSAAASFYAMEGARMENTSTQEMFDSNANWWLALPAEFIWDVTGVAEAGINALGKTNLLAGAIGTPAQRRMLTAVESRSAQTQDVALNLVNEIVNNPDGIGAKTGNVLRDIFQTKNSKAYRDGAINFTTLTNLLADVTTKEDARLIIQNAVNDTDTFIREGMDTNLFTSPGLQISSSGGRNYFGWAGLGQRDALYALESLRGTDLDMWLNALPSLSGTGTLDKTDFMTDLAEMLVQKAANRFGVSVLDNVPMGVNKATVRPTANGNAVIDYYADVVGANGKKTSQVVGSSREMSQVNADSMVKTVQQEIKKEGVQMTQNPLNVASRKMRHWASNLFLNSDPGSVVNNFAGASMAAIWDGTFSFVPKAEQDAFLINKLGGLPSAVRETQVYGTAQEFLGDTKIPLLHQIQKARQGETVLWGTGGRVKVGEQAMAQSIRYKAMRDFYETEWAQRGGEAIENILVQAGVPAERVGAMKDALITTGIYGSRGDVAKKFQQIANGMPAISITSIDPRFIDVFGDLNTKYLDDLISSMHTGNVADTQSEIERIYRSTMARWRHNYPHGPDPLDRNVWTQFEETLDYQDLAEAFQTVAGELQLGEDGIKPLVDGISTTMKDVNNRMNLLLQMMAGNPQGSEVFFHVWDEVENLKNQYRTLVDTMAKNAVAQPAGSAARAAKWNEYYTNVPKHWDEFGKRATKLMEEARDRVVRGDWSVPGVGNPQEELLRALATEVDPLWDAIKNAPNMIGKTMADEQMFEAAKAAGREGVRKFQAEMMVAFNRMPTPENMDLYLSAIRNVNYKAKKAVANITSYNAYIRGVIAKETDPGKIAALWNKYGQYRNKQWENYYKFAFDRYHAASLEMLRQSFGQDVLRQLRFRPPGMTTYAQIRGVDIRNPKKLAILFDDGTTGSVFRSNVPQDTLDLWDDLVKKTEEKFANEVGRIGAQTMGKGTGWKPVDDAIAAIAGKTNTDMYKTVRSNLLSQASNPKGVSITPDRYVNYMENLLDRAVNGLISELPRIAQLNEQGYGKLSMDVIARFNKEVLPLFDNVATAGAKYADDMVGLGMLNYLNEYYPDVIMSLMVPFHFFSTRMGKNAAERMMFSPRVFGALNKYRVMNESRSRERGDPDRRFASIEIPGTNIAFQDPMPKWAPFLPLFVLNGFSNPNRAYRSEQYIRDAIRDRSWPGLAKGLGPWAMELMNVSGYSPYPWWQTIGNIAAGDADQISMQQYGTIAGTIGYGMASVLKEKMPWLTKYATPHYSPHLVGREIVNETVRGNVPDENTAIMAMDIARQQRTGEQPLPQQETMFPLAGQVYADARDKTFREYFTRGLISWLTDLSPAPYPEEEQLVSQAAKVYYGLGQSEENPAGGTTARSYYLNEVAPEGTRARLALGAVMPGEEPEDSTRPGTRAVESLLYDEREMLYKRSGERRTAISEEAAAADEWASRGDMNAAQEADLTLQRDLQQIETIQAEIDALPRASKAYGKETTNKNVVERKGDWMRFVFGSANNLPGRPDALPEGATKAQKAENRKAWDDYIAKQEEYIRRHLSGPGDYVSDQLRSQRGGVQLTPEEALETWQLYKTRYDTDELSEHFRKLDLTWDLIEQQTQQTRDNVSSRFGDKALEAFDKYSNTESGSPERAKIVKANPGISLITLAAYNPEKYDEMEKRFGDDKLMNYAYVKANLPEYPEGGTQAQLDSYYDKRNALAAQYPGYDEVSLWVNGINDWDENDPGSYYDFGHDYQEAIGIFGQDIFTNLAEYNAARANGTYGEWGRNNPEKMGKVIGYFDWRKSSKQRLADPTARYGPQERPEITPSTADAIARGETPAPAPAPAQPEQGDTLVEAAQAADVPATEVQPTQSMYGMPLTSPNLAQTQGFGDNPEDYAQFGLSGHEGVDFGVPVGTSVVSAGDGKVIRATSDTIYGNYVAVDHGDGNVTYYAHLSGLGVEVGDEVEQGQEIGLSGNTGRSTGPHLHFGVRVNGQWADPIPFVTGQATVAGTTPVAPAGAVVGNKVTSAEPLDEQHQFGNWQDYALSGMLKNGREAALQEGFDEGTIYAWFSRPRWDGTEATDAARADYFRANPQVWLLHQFMRGRPDEIEDSADPNFQWNAGVDYNQAKKLFGSNIWGIVLEARGLPEYGTPNGKQAWIDFHENNPQYKAWRDWWYEKMSGYATTASAQNSYGYGRGYSSGWSGYSSGGSDFNFYNYYNVRLQPGRPPHLNPRWRPSYEAPDWRSIRATIGPRGR